MKGYFFGVAKRPKDLGAKALPLGVLLGGMYVGVLSLLYFVQTKKTVTEWRKYNEMEKRIAKLKFT